MSFTIETVPTLISAEKKLLTLLAVEQKHPSQRLNLLVGSNLQRLYFRRLLAAQSGATANLRFYTPVDLAMAIREIGTTLSRHSTPDGAEILLIDEIMQNIRNKGMLRRLDPEVKGITEAVASTMTDLREANISPNEFLASLRPEDDGKIHDLAYIYEKFTRKIEDYLDRTALYEDALSPEVTDSIVHDALGGSALIVIGLYDAPTVQLELLRRCADVVNVYVVVVAPADPDFSFARQFVRNLISRGASENISVEDHGKESSENIVRYFNAPSRIAEAEEIVRRVLTLARDEAVPFNAMAILHRLDKTADDLLAATLQRAGIPVYRSAGHSIQNHATGNAALALLKILCCEPQRHELMEFLANPALSEKIPPGIKPTPALWERHSKKAGMVQGWERILLQLKEHINQLKRAEQSKHAISTAENFQEVLHELQRMSGEITNQENWEAYSACFINLLDEYLTDEEQTPNVINSIRQHVRAIGKLDIVMSSADPESFYTVTSRAIQRAVINDTGALTTGIFLGNVSAARSVRFRAIFLAECAERIFPALVRQDPLLLDFERQRINRQLQRPALPIKHERQQEELMLFQLIEQSSAKFLNISWARRTNSAGAPKLGSPLLLKSITETNNKLIPAEQNDDNTTSPIVRLPARLAGAAPSHSARATGDWSSVYDALDESDFRLALLESTVDSSPKSVLSHLWTGYQRYDLARQARNSTTFGPWDGVLPESETGYGIFDTEISPTALETYATCPYRYFLRNVLGVGSVSEPSANLVMAPLDRGAMVHRILERWIRAALENNRPWIDFLGDNEQLESIAEEEFEFEQHGGLSGLPATWAIVKSEIRADLRELVRIERERANQGYIPLAAELEISNLEIDCGLSTPLHFRGRIDRVDQGPKGLIAIDYKTGDAIRSAEAYRSGSALQLPIYIHGIADHYGIEPTEAAAEFWYASRRGRFVRSTIYGSDIVLDPELNETLKTITTGIRTGRFFPYPGNPSGERKRPNCTNCDYFTVCSTDVDNRFEHKKRTDQNIVRDFLSMQARSQ